MTASQRLHDLGIELPEVIPPAGAYQPAVRSGSLVFTAGQLPIVDGRLVGTGKVGAAGASGADVTPGEASGMARSCALNALAAVHALVGVDSVRRVVKVTGFVASAPGFTEQPGVIDGASTLFGEVFGESGAHARSAVGVAELPRNAPVEVEIVVEVGEPDDVAGRPTESPGEES